MIMEQNVDVIDLNNVKAHTQKKNISEAQGWRVGRGTHLRNKRSKKLFIPDGTRN